jgi:DNA repair exonuclease SbcCD ATPase subunit
VCTRCQAARGPNLINKLDFVLSDRSGAAEDLAGAALQLSASAWLRAEKGSLWETAIIDEAFGQLDGANRRALGRHLAALLAGRYGFSQALVVAHSSDVLEALPGRIEIEGGPRGSSVRVVG